MNEELDTEKNLNSSSPETVAPSVKRDRMRWLRERIIPIVSLSMAVFSISVAWLTITRSNESGKQLQAISDNLKITSERLNEEVRNISQNLTTRYLGKFPIPLKELAGVLKEVHPGEEVIIICDFPGYGLFSDYEGFQEYDKNIKLHISKKVPITMLVLSWENQWLTREAQYRTREIDDIKGHPKFIQFSGWSGHNPVDIRTKKDLFTALEKEQKEVWESFRGIQTRCVYNETSLPMFLWIVGNRVAVFSIPDLGNTEKSDAVETMFTTRDERLIKQLKTVAENYQNASNCQSTRNEKADAAR